MTIRYPVAILVNAKPGYSDYNLGEQLRTYLEGRGVEVRMFDKKQPGIFGKTVGCHLVSFYTDMVWPQYRYARLVRPKSLLHIQCIGPKVYPLHEYLCYLSTLAKPKASGIPVTHVNVSWSTEHDFKAITRDWFAPSKARGILERAVTIPYGIEDGFVPWVDANPDSVVVPYNRWEAGQKNLPLHMRLSRLYALQAEMDGRKVETVFYRNADPYGQAKAKDVPAEASEIYDFRDQFYDRPTFRAEIGQHGLFLCTSLRESFGLYYLELLMAGVVGVFQSYPWIEHLLPEYPYIVSEPELLPQLAWIREHYEEARVRIRDEIIPLIAARYGQARYLEGLWAQIAALDAMDDREPEQEEPDAVGDWSGGHDPVPSGEAHGA